jgi:hypothetical protein
MLHLEEINSNFMQPRSIACFRAPLPVLIERVESTRNAMAAIVSVFNWSVGAVLMKRPAAVDSKVRIGDWEADTVVVRPEDEFV